MNKNPRILVITSCSKKKEKNANRALDLYKGQFFLGVKKFCEKNCFDLMVLSAKYGLIKDEIIEPYEQRLQNTKRDINRLRALAFPKFKDLIPKYDYIIFLMGKTYASVLNTISPKIRYATDPTGSGGFNQLIVKLNNLSKGEFISLINQNKTFSRFDITN
jgi:hypothetical protein